MFDLCLKVDRQIPNTLALSKSSLKRALSEFVHAVSKGLKQDSPLVMCEVSQKDAFKGPKDHINIRILHPGSKAHHEGDARNHGL